LATSTRYLRLACVAALLCGATAKSATIAVPGDAPTIARGLALARPGDIVLVACGTYREHDLVIPAGVSLWSGAMQPGCAVIDAGGAGRVLICEGVDSTSAIVGFTLTGGRAQGEGDAGRGGAVLCRNASPRLDKCVLRGNTARDGGAIAVVGSGRPLLTGCRLWDNTALNAGGAVAWRNVHGGRLEACDLRQNHAGNAGGAIYAVAASLALVDCLLADNTAGVAGAALALDATAARCVGCTLTGNRTEPDGGVVLAVNAASLFDRCLIVFNDTGELAGDGPAWPQFMRSSLHGNRGPDWAAPVDDQRDRLGNLARDPLFCDRERHDYRLRPGSPCLLAGGEPIGAFGLGCGAP
jgi:predicted outer membrane repeat protein